MSLTRRIEASLLRNNFSLTRLHVEVLEKGVAHIRGLVETEEVRSRLIDEVKGVPGVSDVQAEVVVLPAAAV
jgi:osmotically-inducible protein OsmY